jgi:hypothetical protein
MGISVYGVGRYPVFRHVWRWTSHPVFYGVMSTLAGVSTSDDCGSFRGVLGTLRNDLSPR